MMVTENNTKKI